MREMVFNTTRNQMENQRNKYDFKQISLLTAVIWADFGLLERNANTWKFTWRQSTVVYYMCFYEISPSLLSSLFCGYYIQSTFNAMNQIQCVLYMGASVFEVVCLCRWENVYWIIFLLVHFLIHSMGSIGVWWLMAASSSLNSNQYPFISFVFAATDAASYIWIFFFFFGYFIVSHRNSHPSIHPYMDIPKIQNPHCDGTSKAKVLFFDENRVY